MHHTSLTKPKPVFGGCNPAEREHCTVHREQAAAHQDVVVLAQLRREDHPVYDTAVSSSSARPILQRSARPGLLRVIRGAVIRDHYDLRGRARLCVSDQAVTEIMSLAAA